MFQAVDENESVLGDDGFWRGYPGCRVACADRERVLRHVHPANRASWTASGPDALVGVRRFPPAYLACRWSPTPSTSRTACLHVRGSLAGVDLTVASSRKTSARTSPAGRSGVGMYLKRLETRRSSAFPVHAFAEDDPFPRLRGMCSSIPTRIERRDPGGKVGLSPKLRSRLHPPCRITPGRFVRTVASRTSETLPRIHAAPVSEVAECCGITTAEGMRLAFAAPWCEPARIPPAVRSSTVM